MNFQTRILATAGAVDLRFPEIQKIFSASHMFHAALVNPLDYSNAKITNLPFPLRIELGKNNEDVYFYTGFDDALDQILRRNKPSFEDLYAEHAAKNRKIMMEQTISEMNKLVSWDFELSKLADQIRKLKFN